MVLFCLLFRCGFSQAPAFYHLTTANGLYDNGVRSLAINRQGFLWIGTEEGLNAYDGRTTTVYLKEKNSGLPSDYISVLHADSKNRLWIGTPEGAAWMDSRRIIHPITLHEMPQRFAVKAFVETKTTGIIFLTDKGFWRFNEETKKGEWLKDITALLPISKLKSVQRMGDDTILFIADSTVSVFDLETKKMVALYTNSEVASTCTLTGNRVAVGKNNGEVLILNANRKIVQRFALQPVPQSTTNTLQPVEMVQAANGDLIIATGLNGLVTINPSGKVSQFVHDPAVITSIIGNSIYRIVTGANGEVAIGTSTSGVSIYNTQLSQAAFKGFFSDTHGNTYDNYTGRMLEDKAGIIWIGAYDRLIKWDRRTGRSSFYFFTGTDDKKHGDIRAMCFDKSGTLWVSIEGKGIASFSESKGFSMLKLDTTLSPAFGAGSVPDMVMDNEGLIWVCTNKGLFTFNPSTKKADALLQHPLAKSLAGKIIQSAFIDSKKCLWLTTIYNGVYCYDKSSGRLYRYTTKQGLPSDICYGVQEDEKGRYFIATSKGMAVITGGSIQALTKSNGLRYDRCESVMTDNENSVWFSNKKCLVRLNADTQELQFFDEKAGLLNDGFRVGSCLKTRDGSMLWGGYRGVSAFHPSGLRHSVLPLQVSIHSLHAGDSL
ncbi:MAG TPA: two-component regulator propeller domain-containing protein, partial [Flavisolibacter sp.]|nr:two-component regulator propeller domain-containing protein [Flavisolibacter sp.]